MVVSVGVGVNVFVLFLHSRYLFCFSRGLLILLRTVKRIYLCLFFVVTYGLNKIILFFCVDDFTG